MHFHRASDMLSAIFRLEGPSRGKPLPARARLRESNFESQELHSKARLHFSTLASKKVDGIEMANLGFFVSLSSKLAF